MPGCLPKRQAESIKNIMKKNNYDEAQCKLTANKLAADTMVDRVTSLGLSVLNILSYLGKCRKTEVYELIHRDHTTVTHNVTRLIEDGYVHEQVISRREKYISLTDDGKKLFVEYLNKSTVFAQELRACKMGRRPSSIDPINDFDYEDPSTLGAA